MTTKRRLNQSLRSCQSRQSRQTRRNNNGQKRLQQGGDDRLFKVAKEGTTVQMERILRGMTPEQVNAQDENGVTALMLSAEHGGEHAEAMMRLLLDAGADANTQHDDGCTALMNAAENGE